MLKISLLNLPFGALNTPSIALTQLKSVVDQQYGEQVDVRVLYFNLDFARYMGTALYQYIAHSVEGLGAGLGEWFFRPLAFPELPDNTQEYFSRYYPLPTKSTQVLKYALLKKRKGLREFLDSLIDRYELDKADVVGLSSMFSQNLACFAVAKRLKERRPDALVIMGGANCESPMGQEIIKNVAEIDYVFSGPALKSFPTFIGHCLTGNRAGCEQIPGVFSRENLSAIDTPGGLAAFGEELDINANVMLDYGPFLDIFEQHFPDQGIKPVLLFETSRGCWWGEKAQCRFCGLNSTRMDHRPMDPEKALQQFQSLFQYAPRFAYLGCVDNVLPKRFVEEVISKLDNPDDAMILYELKVPTREEELQILADHRVHAVQTGIEALSTPSLKLLRKGTTAFQNLTFLKDCLRFGIYPIWNFLVGVPGEDEAIYEKYCHDLPLFMHLPPPSGMQLVRFDRYSPYFDHADDYDLDLSPSDFYSMVYPFAQETLHKLAYHFTNQDVNAPYLAAICKWNDPLARHVNEWIQRWNGQDGSLHPQLYFRDACVVYDTRSGEAVEHTLDPLGASLLYALSQPRRMVDLVEMFGCPEAELAQQVQLLAARGLIFEENGRFFSLVLPKEPPSTPAQALQYFASFNDFLSHLSN